MGEKVQTQITSAPATTNDPLALAHRILEIFEEKQAEDLILLDMRPVTLIADYFLISTAASTRQSKALVDEVTTRVKREMGTVPLGVHGHPESGWVIMDYGSVVVHVFDPERRVYYDLEGLWADAPVVVRVP